MRGKFPKKKLTYIELLACGKKKMTEVCEIVGISKDTYYKWRKDPEIMEAMIKRARELLREELPEIYNVLLTKAKEGGHHHIRILLEHVEKLEQWANEASAGSIVIKWRE